VIHTIVRLATNPEDEVVVGPAGKVAVAAHGLVPDTVEKMMGKHAHKEMMEKVPPAEETPGNVQQPSKKGTGVRGGRLKK
jgi:hypothetical protein